MLLSDQSILEERSRSNISIEPFNDELVQPVSYDVLLSADFKKQVWQSSSRSTASLDPSEDCSQYFKDVRVLEGGFLEISPGEFILGSTYEVVELGANIAASLEGKSSLGRLGLVVHATAGLIDPGFRGQITLELSNVGTMPIVLWPGMKIAQLCFYRTQDIAQMLYGSQNARSHYQHQHGPTVSRSHENFRIYDVYSTSDS